MGLFVWICKDLSLIHQLPRHFDVPQLWYEGQDNITDYIYAKALAAGAKVFHLHKLIMAKKINNLGLNNSRHLCDRSTTRQRRQFEALYQGQTYACFRSLLLQANSICM